MVQLPAMNTPQFTWARTKLSRKPQPVPPIFQPEIAAEAVVWAARNRRRELKVGWPTLQVVLGNRLAPGIVDLYLGRTGYSAQQVDEPVEPDRADNLFDTVPSDVGAHGEFGDRAKERSYQLWASLHRDWFAFAAGAGAAALALVRLGRD